MTLTKSEWRRVLLAARATIPEEVRRRHSAAIVERARRLPWFDTAGAILGYVAMGAEVDPAPLLQAVQPVLLPVQSPDGEPNWRRQSDSTRRNETSGASLPACEIPYPVLVIVPGVGYDPKGGRLGRGQGFYDRALSDLRQHGPVWVLALAFDCQVVPEVPTDPWDARVDVVVTERRVIDTAVPERPREEIVDA